MKNKLNIDSWRCDNLAVQMLAIAFIMLTACSSWYQRRTLRTDGSSKKESTHEYDVKAQENTKRIRIISEADSSETSLTTEIIPKGRFKYSADKGFRGEAEKLVLNEHARQGRSKGELVHLIQNSRQDSQGRMSVAETVESHTKQKELRPPDLSWLYMGGCACIFVLIYRFRRLLAA